MTQSIDTQKSEQKDVGNQEKALPKDKEKFKRIYKEMEKSKKDSTEQEETPVPLPLPLHLLFSEKTISDVSAEISKPQAVCSVEQVFEKMVGMMSVMHTSGVSETTIFLNSPEIETSVFYGTKIVITEYSTAPKTFNVQIVASSEALVVFQKHAPQLMTLFDEGDYHFKIHRLETSELPVGYDEDEESLEE